MKRMISVAAIAFVVASQRQMPHLLPRFPRSDVLPSWGLLFNLDIITTYTILLVTIVIDSAGV
jgi:hypothetical protein